MGIITNVTPDTVKSSASILEFLSFAIENPKAIKAATKELTDVVTMTEQLEQEKADAEKLIAESKTKAKELEAKQADFDKSSAETTNQLATLQEKLKAKEAQIQTDSVMAKQNLAMHQEAVAQDKVDLKAKQDALDKQAAIMEAKKIEAEKVLSEQARFEDVKAKFEVFINKRVADLDSKEAALNDREAKLRELLG